MQIGLVLINLFYMSALHSSKERDKRMNHTRLEQILNQAMMDEIRARDSYRKIIETFGPVRPLSISSKRSNGT